MATFGSGINAQLGAIDYSPILRGAQAQAQGILAGGQGIARGIESMGGSVANAMEKYQEQAKQNKQKEAVVKDGIKFIETMQKLPGISPELKQMSGSLLETLHSPNASLEDRFAAVQGE